MAGEVQLKKIKGRFELGEVKKNTRNTQSISE